MIAIQRGAMGAHVLGWPGCADPSPFGLGIAADNRRFVAWERHQPTPGGYVWDDPAWPTPAGGYYRNPEFAVTEWRKHGLNTVLVLRADKRPAWSNLDDDASWSAWVAAACKRWRPPAIELINEPSGRITDMSWLVRMFALGRAAAHAVDPSIKIVGPSCESISNPGNGVEFTTAFLKAGGAAQIDVLGVHLYPHGLPTHDPLSILDQMAWLRRNVDPLWSGPVWNTESGCNGETFPAMSRERQLREIRAHLLLPLLGGCERTWWYGFGEDTLGPYESPYLIDVCREFQRMKALEGQEVSEWARWPSGRVSVRLGSGEVIEV